MAGIIYLAHIRDFTPVQPHSIGSEKRLVGSSHLGGLEGHRKYQNPTLCSFLYVLMKTCFLLPVILSMVVQTPAALQVMQGSLLLLPLQQVDVVFAPLRCPSRISWFLASSKQLSTHRVTQHLKKPPDFRQPRANPVFSCDTKVVFAGGQVVGNLQEWHT